MAPPLNGAYAAATDDGQSRLRGWIESYGPALRSHFRKRGAAADAEDLTQEVFLRLRRAASDNSIENIEGYIFRVANNVLISRSRSDRVHGRTFSVPLEDGDGGHDHLSPERILLARENWSRFTDLVTALPPRTQEAFLLHRFEEMTYAAISRRMGISVSAVEKLIGRALEVLLFNWEQP
jgi:RNA polymerase sigma factor (sigma-70 family)